MAGWGNRYFLDPLIYAKQESGDIVDEFFLQANKITKAVKDAKKRNEALVLHKDR